MTDLSANEFMVAFWQAKLKNDEDELKRLKMVPRFANPAYIAALEKWVEEGRKILKVLEKI